MKEFLKTNPSSDKILGHLKCQCNKYLILLAIFDIFLCIPAMAYILASCLQTGETNVVTMLIGFHLATAVVFGFMSSWKVPLIETQMFVAIFFRQCSVLLLIAIAFSHGFEREKQVLLWLAAVYSQAVATGHFIITSMHKRSPPQLSHSDAHKDTISRKAILCRTWISATIITILATVIASSLAESDVKLLLPFGIYVFFAELTMIPSYFYARMKMNLCKQVRSRGNDEIEEDVERKKKNGDAIIIDIATSL